MNRRNIILSSVALLTGKLGAGVAAADTTCEAISPVARRCVDSLDAVDLIQAIDDQHNSEWCWAACISMVFAFYGHAVSQERIVAETFGSIENWPAYPNQILAKLNKRWTDDDGKSFRSYATVNSSNIQSIGRDLHDNLPMIVGTLGHCMILQGRTYLENVYNGAWQVESLSAVDPWPLNPRVRDLTPLEVIHSQFVIRIRIHDV